MPESIKKIIGDKEGKVFIALFDWKKDIDYVVKMHKQKSEKHEDSISKILEQGDEAFKGFLYMLFKNMSIFGFVVWHCIDGKAYRAGIVYLTDMRIGFDGLFHPIADCEHLRFMAKIKNKDKVMFVAGRLFLDFLFKKLNFIRISSNCFLNNLLTICFVKRLGFKEEGIKRQSSMLNGIPVDTFNLGIIRKDLTEG